MFVMNRFIDSFGFASSICEHPPSERALVNNKCVLVCFFIKWNLVIINKYVVY